LHFQNASRTETAHHDSVGWDVSRNFQDETAVAQKYDVEIELHQESVNTIAGIQADGVTPCQMGSSKEATQPVKKAVNKFYRRNDGAVVLP